MNEPSHENRSRQRLEAAFRRGAEAASRSLSRWIGRHVRITVSQVREVELAEAADVLGPGESLVASCALELSGSVPGTMLLVFEDGSGLAIIDALLARPAGTAEGWGELERSAAEETANIVGCSFLSALTDLDSPIAGVSDCGPFIPTPPMFRKEFAASLLQFAVMDQAARRDRVLMIENRFWIDGSEHDWALLLVPGASALATLGLGEAGTHARMASDRSSDQSGAQS